MPIITNFLPKTYAAKIVIEGLFVLCLNDENRTAEFGVYEYANQHEFFIRACQKEMGREKEAGVGGQSIIRLSEIRTGDIYISIEGRSADIACYNYEKVDSQVLLTNPQISSDVIRKMAEYGTDFRWIMDLEGERFHRQQLNILPGVLKRKLILPNGILATERLVGRKRKYAFEQAAMLSKPERDISPLFLFVANQISAIIPNISDNETLRLSYSANGKLQTIVFPRLNTGLYHEIYISNNCPASIGAQNNILSDFQHYYSVLDVHVADRFDLEALLGVGTRIYPCDVAYLGSSTQLS